MIFFKRTRAFVQEYLKEQVALQGNRPIKEPTLKEVLTEIRRLIKERKIK